MPERKIFLSPEILALGFTSANQWTADQRMKGQKMVH